MNDLPTERVELSEANLADAILASGSIPMVMEGVEGIARAPEVIYRDGLIKASSGANHRH